MQMRWNYRNERWKNFSCDKCGEIYYIGRRGNGWDILIENDKTDWIFPMVKRKEK